MSAKVTALDSYRSQQKTPLNLPGPRIWLPEDLAKYLRVSVSWVSKRLEKKAKDPIPRIPGVSHVRFDSESPAFQDWMRRQLGIVDSEASDE